MATRITMKHPSSGIVKDGFYGFSWTTLFFGCIPALFRGDFITFLGGFAILFILAITTWGIGTFIAMIVWAFLYNSYYTKRLLEKGYIFASSESEIINASNALSVSVKLLTKEQDHPIDNQSRYREPLKATHPTIALENKELSKDAYKIYLVKKYKIENNDVLKQFVFNDSLYESVELALEAAHNLEIQSDRQAEKKLQPWTVTDALHALESDGYQIESSSSGYKLRKNKFTRYMRDDEELIIFARSMSSQSTDG